ncbi:MAG: hypothetical protein AAGF95_08555 [Chloroflexota bacterium]
METLPHQLLDVIKTHPDIEAAVWADSQQQVQWWPLLPVQDPLHRLGLTTLGQWVTETRMGLYELQSSTSFVRVFPLLEQPYTDVVQQLFQRSPAEEWSDVLVSHFPSVEVVRAGLTQGSSYWASLAFEWFDELSLPQQQALTPTLEEVAQARWAGQPLRHRAKQCLKQLRKM